ncbi:MAG: hypothetical protein ABIH08_00150 [Candidatus Omnitrophota bacterium]
MKIIKCYFSFAISLVIVFSTQVCWAAVQADDATWYDIIFTELWAKESTLGWQQMRTMNSMINICDPAASGMLAGSISSDFAFPAGNYVNFRIVISNVIKFAGKVGSRYTQEGGQLTIRGTSLNGYSTALWSLDNPNGLPNVNFIEGVPTTYTTSAPTPPSAGTVWCTLELGAASGANARNDGSIWIQRANDLGTSLAIPLSEPLTDPHDIIVAFTFDTSNTVYYDDVNDLMFFIPPQSVGFTITIDGGTPNSLGGQEFIMLW